jgi:hypothetical protein
MCLPATSQQALVKHCSTLCCCCLGGTQASAAAARLCKAIRATALGPAAAVQSTQGAHTAVGGVRWRPYMAAKTRRRSGLIKGTVQCMQYQPQVCSVKKHTGAMLWFRSRFEAAQGVIHAGADCRRFALTISRQQVACTSSSDIQQHFTGLMLQPMLPAWWLLLSWRFQLLVLFIQADHTG